MLRKYASLCGIAWMLSASVGLAEEFSPYHPGAFSGFWIKKPTFNIRALGNVKQGAAANQMWSDDYWAKYAGGLAYRYAAPGFWIDPKKPRPKDWMVPANYILKKRPANTLISEGRINQLSPAEKYDVLVGDTGNPTDPKDQGFTLTRAFLNEINAKTQPWEGACDGWAFASINEKPPVRAVTVKSAEGQEITFYPSDIRALLTLLYSDYKVASFGSHCYEKRPQLDGIGRVRDAGCRDTNPGIFHVLLVNQMGIGKRGLVMDTDYSSEVWNYPIKSYKMKYFNPQTNMAYEYPIHAVIKKSDYHRDRYAQYRSEKTAYIVGVDVELEYQIEAYPRVAKQLGKDYERSFKNSYRYDLELDLEGNVIGGEWGRLSQKNHPDLLSFVAPSYINKSPYDWQVRGNNLPQMLRSIHPKLVQETSAQRRPLFKVVKALAAMSQ